MATLQIQDNNSLGELPFSHQKALIKKLADEGRSNTRKPPPATHNADAESRRIWHSIYI
jgi:hypothetical protein